MESACHACRLCAFTWGSSQEEEEEGAHQEQKAHAQPVPPPQPPQQPRHNHGTTTTATPTPISTRTPTTTPNLDPDRNSYCNPNPVASPTPTPTPTDGELTAMLLCYTTAEMRWHHDACCCFRTRRVLWACSVHSAGDLEGTAEPHQVYATRFQAPYKEGNSKLIRY